jgi:GH24 family phage-related lysozyme (muramidase)
MSINTSNIPLSELQRIYNTQQTILGDMKDNDILLPGMSAEDFKKINEAIGKLDLEGGQPDPVGDDADKNSPNASINAGLQDMSLNPNMSPEEAAEKHGTTVAALANLNSEYAQREPKLGAFVSFIGNTFGPKIGPMVENLRETPRQSYSRMTSRFAQAKYGLPPSEYGLSLPSFSPTSKTEPVSFVPYSPEDQDLYEAQQAAAAQEEAEVGIGPVGAGGYDSKNQATIDAALDQSRMEGYDKMTGGDFDAPASYGMFDDPSYDAPDTGNENEGDQTGGAGEYGGPSGAGGMGGYLNTGGRVGALIQHLRTGGDVENAETNMGNANIPMGIVNDPDGAPSPFSGGTGVEDDLDMDVEAGSYVLNAESVQLIGISDINAVIRDAYSIAAALGQPMPQDYDPQNKVPIRISNGEAVIPKPLVDIIGLDKLEKWNKKGLELRKQKEKMMAQQQQAQPPQQQQVAAEAPMQQQMGQLMNEGGQAKEEAFSTIFPTTSKEKLIKAYTKRKIEPIDKVLYKQLTNHEGKLSQVYLDSKNIPTVGIGYNLENPSAKKDFDKIGANYITVKTGQSLLTNNQITDLFNISLNRAKKDVINIVPNFKSLPTNIKNVLIDMSFNLGQPRLKKFKKMLKAVNKKDFREMKKEMINSNWYNQVGDRAQNLIKLVEKEI